MAQLIVMLLFSLLLPSTLYAGTTLKDLPLQPNSVLNPLAGNPGIDRELIGLIGQEEGIGIIAISVRDVETGYALPAFISISKVEKDGSIGPNVDSFQASLGEILKRYPPGKYNIELQVEGYKPMKSWFVIEAGKTFRDRYMLSPSASKMRELEKQLEAEQATIPMNMAIVSGYVTDDETGGPLEDVRVVFEKSGIETYADQRGYYEAVIPIGGSVHFNGEEIRALQENVFFSHTGFKTRKEINVLIMANQSLRRNMLMFKGVGEIISLR